MDAKRPGRKDRHQRGHHFAGRERRARALACADAALGEALGPGVTLDIFCSPYAKLRKPRGRTTHERPEPWPAAAERASAIGDGHSGGRSRALAGPRPARHPGRRNPQRQRPRPARPHAGLPDLIVPRRPACRSASSSSSATPQPSHPSAARVRPALRPARCPFALPSAATSRSPYSRQWDVVRRAAA